MNDNILRLQLVELVKGGLAYSPVDRVLAGILPENRNKKIKPEMKTIWEELEHVRITQKDIIEYTLSADWESPSWPEGYWPKPEQEADENVWQETVKSMMNDLQRVRELINDKEINLTEKIPHGQDHTYLREILLIAEHNAYHMGKIVLMRKLLLNW
jgi:uncharacterized damage-inducible protein DinB